MTNEEIRLNPFVYISETDIRFYLLVLIGIIVPSLFILLSVIVIVDVENTLFLRLLIAILCFSFIPLLVYWDYKRYPKRIIKKAKLKEFSRKRYPEPHEYIENLHREYLSTEKKPVLMIRPTDYSLDCETFGTKNHMFIYITGGLIRVFRKNINEFKSIYLHETAHIVNRDVVKTFLANSTWRSLFLTLSIPLGIVLITLFLALGIFIIGILAGYDMNVVTLKTIIRIGVPSLVGLTLFFLLFLGIIYVLRNQIIRLREFYADAKVLEWEESPDMIVKTLEESGGKQHSKFEILKKFHPNINERIQVLKNNKSLFVPSLWLAFSIGLSYSIIELYSLFFKTLIFSDAIWVAAMEGGEYQVPTGDAFRAFISIIFFTILMLAVSSSLHKSILKDIFIDNTGYFSLAKILDIIKFSLVFSFGYSITPLLGFLTVVGREDVNFLSDFFDVVNAWIYHAVYFSIAMIFLLIFARMLIQRSFSKKESQKNYLLITVIFSILYLINRFIAVETLVSKPLVIVFFFIFSAIAYTVIKKNDEKLLCPGCGKKIDINNIQLNCPKCQHNLYSWAIYSF